MSTKKAIWFGFLLGVGVSAALFTTCSLLFVDPQWEKSNARSHPKGGSVTMDTGPLVRSMGAASH